MNVSSKYIFYKECFNWKNKWKEFDRFFAKIWFYDIKYYASIYFMAFSLDSTESAVFNLDLSIKKFENSFRKFRW